MASLRAFIFGWCLAAGGCVAPQALGRDDWPSGIPPRSYYERVWEADTMNREIQTREQYLEWVTGFYAGSWLAAGWTRRQADLIAPLEARDLRLAEPELRFLGQLLSSEWAKDNRTRRVNSDLLALWGGVMAEGRAHGRFLETLNLITADARGVLSGEIDPADITRQRYAPVLLSRP
jgi:hypothetical protein